MLAVSTRADAAQFYGLFKQANEGDNTKPKPGMMDFTGKAKWSVSSPRPLAPPRAHSHPLTVPRAAWNNVKGLSTEEAKSNYVAAFLAVRFSPSLDRCSPPQVLEKSGSEEAAALKAQIDSA